MNNFSEFYQKIGVPPPKLSPEERKRRRLSYRNEHILYRRKSSLSGKPIVSFFHPDSPYTIYSKEEWWADGWNAISYGQDFDFNKPFFDQFHGLQLKVPRPPLINNKCLNSDFCNFSDENKNCYLMTSSNYDQDCYYGFLSVRNKNAVDGMWCTDSEIMYECIDCQKCFNLRHAQNCENCSDSSFLSGCQAVKNCILCIGLRNKEYYILNKPASKEEYEKTMEEINGSYPKYQEMLEKFEALKKDYPIRQANNFFNSENVTGDNIYNSRNIEHGFDIYDSEDVSWSHDGLKALDCMDICFFHGAELCYESTSIRGNKCLFCIYCRESYNLEYCDNCHACKNCFGCVGLRNKEYCILNKQYSKEEYEELYKKIVQHMTSTAEYGEFFPIKYSLFAYNETLAQDYFPITKETAAEQGWAWREESVPRQADKTIPASRLPDKITDIPDDIVNWAIECAATKRLFKIIPQELRFYRDHRIPLPRLHPDERRRRRIEKRNPQKLFNRNCAKCGSEIQTSYSPERPEEVYCKRCYLSELY